MKKKKKVSPLDEYIKANRKGSREAEIENHGRPVSHNRVHSMQQEGMTQTEDTRDDWLLPVCSLQKIDDFQADAVVRRVNPKAAETVCTATLISVISIIVLFLFMAFWECLFYFSEKRISFFRVVVFIHRIDGKKKSRFENGKHYKTGGFREWKLEQNSEFYQSMRKKRYSII